MAKELIESLSNKVPQELQKYTEYKELTAIVKKFRIKTLGRLNAYLKSETSKTENLFAEENRQNSTISRKRINHAKKLDTLKRCTKLLEKYLS